MLQARIRHNLGVLAERRHDLASAEEHYRVAAEVAVAVTAIDIAARALSGWAFLLEQQGRRDEAREGYRRCIDLAAAAGEVFFQGVAMASLAELENDPDAMEVALELIEESGDLDQLASVRRDYETLLTRMLQGALTRGDVAEAQHLLGQLGDLYQRQQRDGPVQRVEETLNALQRVADPAGSAELLMALLAGAPADPDGLAESGGA